MNNSMGIEIAKLLEQNAEMSRVLLDLTEKYSNMMQDNYTDEESNEEFTPTILKVISNE